jgi:hypothetical protein
MTPVPPLFDESGDRYKGTALLPTMSLKLTNQVASAAGALALLITIFTGGAAMACDLTKEDSNKAYLHGNVSCHPNSGAKVDIPALRICAKSCPQL